VITARRALGWLALGAVLAIARFALPFATGILLGTLMAFTLEPLYAKLVQRSDRPVAASLLTISAATILIVGALGAFVTRFITGVVELANTVREQLHTQGPLSTWVDAGTSWLERFGISQASVTSHLQATAGQIASSSATMAGSLATGTFAALLDLFFAMLTMHLVLRYWPRMVTAIVVVSPLDPKHTRGLLAEFQRVGRMTVLGTVLTGLAQGALAAMGFWITGVPHPVFFGIATALASLIPAVGTLLIWVSAGVFLFASGHPGKAIIELIWGAMFVVGLCDYLIRPRLVGDAAMPALLVFIALFGGLKVLGLSGLIVGPVIMALAVTVLRLYSMEYKHKRAAQ
jgi:predicted PurR-regulated permease PerM